MSRTMVQRPKDLTPVSQAASGAGVPASLTEEGVFEWAEALRDEYENKGKLLTVAGLIKTARGLPEDDAPEVVKQLRVIYADEYKDEKANAGKPPAGKAVAKGRGGKTKLVDAKPSKNGHAKNGKATPGGGKALAKGSKPKAAADTEVTISLSKTVKGVPVTVGKTAGGKSRVTVFGVKLRPFLRWTGKDKWDREDTVRALKRLGVYDLPNDQVVGGTMTLDSVITDHMGSGRKGDEGWHGPAAVFTKDQVVALRGLKS